MYSRRTVKDAFRLQEAVATAFTEENFGDYNEKTFLDIATAEEMFDWMVGPLQDGLFPDTLYNEQPLPEDRKGYVMTYNRIVGKIRLRQLRVAPDIACSLASSIHQDGVTVDGSRRHRQFVDHCYGAYTPASRSNESYGPADLQAPFTGGFAFSNASANNLPGVTIDGQVNGVKYDGSGFVRDLEAQNRTAYIEALEQLRGNLWVDERTRAVIVSLNLCNGNYNYYCISQFLLEFSQGGTVVPTATNRILRLDLYESSSFSNVNVILTLYTPEVLIALGALAYLFHFFYKVYRTKKVTKRFRHVFNDSWVLVDLLMLVSLGTTFLLRFTFYTSAERRSFMPFNRIEGGEYREMTSLARSYGFIFVIVSMGWPLQPSVARKRPRHLPRALN